MRRRSRVTLVPVLPSSQCCRTTRAIGSSCLLGTGFAPPHLVYTAPASICGDCFVPVPMVTRKPAAMLRARTCVGWDTRFSRQGAARCAAGARSSWPAWAGW